MAKRGAAAVALPDGTERVIVKNRNTGQIENR